ncbi:MAG TPA: hydrogenase expression/formation protein HypE [Polyangiaceae bacterium]
MSEPDAPGGACPLPLRHDHIELAHGGGGRLTRDLVERLFLPAFDAVAPRDLHDSACFRAGDSELAFTTDSYVVSPLFFPGGDIGTLAVYGTVNDLAMAGAEPFRLSAGFILEEGLAVAMLERVVHSMAAAARAADVKIVAGDTKVVERGRCDGLYVNTAGIGLCRARLAPGAIEVGDAILLSGDLGRHGVAVLAQREGLEFETTIESDCANLAPLVRELLRAGVSLHCARDLTRGGFATALGELSLATGLDFELDEATIPVHAAVQAACELLGLDPLYVANEGRFVAFVPERDVMAALDVLRRHSPAEAASVVGRVVRSRGARGQVSLRSRIGGIRLVDLLSGEQLPRIC